MPPHHQDQPRTHQPPTHPATQPPPTHPTTTTTYPATLTKLVSRGICCLWRFSPVSYLQAVCCAVGVTYLVSSVVDEAVSCDSAQTCDPRSFGRKDRAKQFRGRTLMPTPPRESRWSPAQTPGPYPRSMSSSRVIKSRSAGRPAWLEWSQIHERSDRKSMKSKSFRSSTGESVAVCHALEPDSQIPGSYSPV